MGDRTYSLYGSYPRPVVPAGLTVKWQSCGGAQGNVWCGLDTVNLEHEHFRGFEGVYIIWRSTDTLVVRVGQGAIADRLRAHRCDRDVLAYQGTGRLLVTWANVPAAYRDGVERFLADHFAPLAGSAFPFTTPIPVNLPEVP